MVRVSEYVEVREASLNVFAACNVMQPPSNADRQQFFELVGELDRDVTCIARIDAHGRFIMEFPDDSIFAFSPFSRYLGEVCDKINVNLHNIPKSAECFDTHCVGRAGCSACSSSHMRSLASGLIIDLTHGDDEAHLYDDVTKKFVFDYHTPHKLTILEPVDR